MADKTPQVRVARIERNASGQLIVHLAGREQPVTDARVARCFPWSLPQEYVSIRDKDGKEVVLLKSIRELNEPDRRLVEEELAQKVFNPRILRVLSYRSEFGVATITAETDRGEVSFQIRGREDVRQLSPTRALFRDVDGNSYEVPDIRQLDRASQKHLSEFF